MTEMNASVRVDLKGNLERRAQRYGRALNRFSTAGERDLSRLRRVTGSLGQQMDRLGGRTTALILGAGTAYATTRAVMESAKLDKSMIRLQHTAGATAQMTGLLRRELFSMAQESGQSLDSLLQGFNSLIQAGMEWDKALATIKAINPTMAVTGSRAEVLAASLGVAAESFDFDLSNVETAVSLLDRMTKAGRLGNAELEDLSSIFARVGPSAQAANLSFDQTLGLIERLSLVERNPERLATMTESTLRLFTNQNYLKKAAEQTGVQFFDAEGQRRAALDVLDDIAVKYRDFSTDAQREAALDSAFGGADLDTIRGLRILLAGDTIREVRGMSEDIARATGTIGKDLQEALDNSVDQVARLKTALREAADSFAQPINDVISDAIKWLMDEQGVTGKQMLIGGALTGLGTLAALKGGGKLMKRFGGVATGVVTGKALEEATGVQPVYVVNMPTAFGGGMPGTPGKGPKRGPGRWNLGRLMPFLGRAGWVGAAGWAGWEAGSILNDLVYSGNKGGEMVGRKISRILALLGDEQAKENIKFNTGDSARMNQVKALAMLSPLAGFANLFDTVENSSLAKKPLEGTIRIEVDSKGQARVTNIQSNRPDVVMDVESGMMGVMP